MSHKEGEHNGTETWGQHNPEAKVLKNQGCDNFWTYIRYVSNILGIRTQSIGSLNGV
jgi:hypothetical protein